MTNPTGHSVASAENTKLGLAALIVGVLGLLAAFAVPLAGWVLGAAAVALGFVCRGRPAAAKQGMIGLWLGVAAILVGLFVFNLLTTGVISFR